MHGCGKIFYCHVCDLLIRLDIQLFDHLNLLSQIFIKISSQMKVKFHRNYWGYLSIFKVRLYTVNHLYSERSSWLDLEACIFCINRTIDTNLIILMHNFYFWEQFYKHRHVSAFYLSVLHKFLSFLNVLRSVKETSYEAR